MKDMAYDLLVTMAAQDDIEDALSYIAETLSNPGAAIKLLNELQAVYDQLRDYPLLYECCHDARLQSMGYRKVTIENFILIYHPVEKDHTVYVMRFFYGGRNYEKLL